MEDIIRRIVSIEDKAQSVMLDARNAEHDLDERVEAEERRIQREIRKKSAERCRKIKEREEEEVRRRIDAITASTKEQLINLEEKYSENKEKWVEDMVSHIIGE